MVGTSWLDRSRMVGTSWLDRSRMVGTSWLDRSRMVGTSWLDRSKIFGTRGVGPKHDVLKPIGRIEAGRLEPVGWLEVV